MINGRVDKILKGGGNYARFMLGFKDVQGGTPKRVRPAG